MSHARSARLLCAFLTAVCAAALTPPAAAQRPVPRAHVVATIDSLAAAFIAEGPVPGISVGVVKGRDTIVMKGYGLADVENEVAASARTVYRIGSITKQFTAAAIMRLVQEGKLALDDTLGKLVPNAPQAWRGVTVRRLLNHTSGIRSYTSVGPRWQRRWREDMSPDTIVGLVRDDTLDFRPGAAWRYNNTGYVLLGMIIERASGKSYATYLEEEFYQPLGLTQTYYCSEQPIIKHRARGYQRSGGRLVNAEYLSMTQPFAAGALCSTVGDLVAWQRALVSGRVVRPPSYAAMITPESLADGKPLTYGYGLGAGTLDNHRKVSHGGGIHGFTSDLAYYPDDSLHVAVLANGQANTSRFGELVARAALGLPLRPTGVALAGAERARYVGTYAAISPPGQPGRMRIFDQDGSLYRQIGSQPAGRLVAQGNHVFVLEDNANIRFTFTVSGDRATKLTIRHPGGTIEAEREP